MLVAHFGHFLPVRYLWPCVSLLLFSCVMLRASVFADTRWDLGLLYSSIDGGWSQPFAQPDQFDLQLGEHITWKPWWSLLAELKKRKTPRESHTDHLVRAHLDIRGLYCIVRLNSHDCLLLDRSLFPAWSAATNSKCDPSQLAPHAFPNWGGRSQQIQEREVFPEKHTHCLHYQLFLYGYPQYSTYRDDQRR